MCAVPVWRGALIGGYVRSKYVFPIDDLMLLARRRLKIFIWYAKRTLGNLEDLPLSNMKMREAVR